MVENAKDAQVFPKEQKEMQKTAKQQRQEQTCAINGKTDHMRRLIVDRRQCNQHRQCGNGQYRADQMADGIEILIAVW